MTRGYSYRAKSGGSPLYARWCGMRERCSRPGHVEYARYGGRGIRVCERWQNFLLFAQDMGPLPGPDYTLDRIDPDGHYEPGNVRWATRTEQARNRRNNCRVEYRGESLTVPEWAERFGLSASALYIRINKLRWPIERALTTPVRVTSRTRRQA